MLWQLQINIFANCKIRWTGVADEKGPIFGEQAIGMVILVFCGIFRLAFCFLSISIRRKD
jgi:hypothetical protein